MTPILWFMIGLWLGGAVGFLTAALFKAAAEADRAYEQMRKQVDRVTTTTRRTPL